MIWFRHRNTRCCLRAKSQPGSGTSLIGSAWDWNWQFIYIYIYIKFCSVFHHLTCTFLQLYIQKKSVGKCRSSTNNHKWVKKQTHRKCCQVFPWAQLFKLSIWMTQEQKLWANQRRPPQTDLSVHLLIPRPPCQTSTTVKPSKSETGWEPEEELVDYSWHNRWVQGILGGGTAPRVEMRN